MYPNFWFYLIVFTQLVAANVMTDIHNTHATTTRPPSAKSIITPPPAFHGKLFRRAIATCGYIRGNSGTNISVPSAADPTLGLIILLASPLTCPDSYNCITTIIAHEAFACCNSIECLDNWGLCQNYGENNCQGYNLDADICSSIYGSILRWYVLTYICHSILAAFLLRI